MLRSASVRVFSDGILAAAFHQDPRYYRIAEGSIFHRGLLSARAGDHSPQRRRNQSDQLFRDCGPCRRRGFGRDLLSRTQRHRQSCRAYLRDLDRHRRGRQPGPGVPAQHYPQGPDSCRNFASNSRAVGSLHRNKLSMTSSVLNGAFLLATILLGRPLLLGQQQTPPEKLPEAPQPSVSVPSREPSPAQQPVGRGRHRPRAKEQQPSRISTRQPARSRHECPCRPPPAPIFSASARNACPDSSSPAEKIMSCQPDIPMFARFLDSATPLAAHPQAEVHPGGEKCQRPLQSAHHRQPCLRSASPATPMPRTDLASRVSPRMPACRSARI